MQFTLFNTFLKAKKPVEKQFHNHFNIQLYFIIIFDIENSLFNNIAIYLFEFNHIF
jgi:hypothetical protein